MTSLVDEIEARAAVTLERIFNQQQLSEHKAESRHEVLLERVKGLDSRISALEREAEVTGTHTIAQLEEQLAQRKAHSYSAQLARNTHWYGVLGGLIVATATAFLTWALTWRKP